MKKLHFLFFTFLIILQGCDPELKLFEPHPGKADLTTYIAIGCSKTAGFTNNELYRFGQIVSYPNILSRQMLHAGGGEFRQPLMRDESGFGNRIILSYLPNCHGDSVIISTLEGSIPDDGNTQNIYETEGPFHNLGVPRAKIAQLQESLDSTSNPFHSYFSRFASSPSASVISDAMQLQATFFSLWVGMSDVLEYAQTGGTNHTVIDVNEFEFFFSGLLDMLISMAEYGVIANIPDILGFPFFDHIKPGALWVTDSFSLEGKRLITNEEKVLLKAFEAIDCLGLGEEDNPIPANMFLSASQVHEINSIIATFNQIIENKASELGLGFVNLYQLYSIIEEGVSFDGIYFTNELIHGGFFSPDGIHLSRRGNAIVANTFIEVINNQYQSSIPKVSVTQYQGIEYP